MLGKSSGNWACLPRHAATRSSRRTPDALAKGGIVFHVLHREEGQGLAEYGLIISIIAVLAVVALMFISGNLDKLLSTVGKGL
jgi:Flp pilus assembly pilin Flp